MLLEATTAGLITSLHCVGMCGPLACAVCPKQRTPEAGNRPTLRAFWALPAYHGGRVISYAVLGGILGALGKTITAVLPAELPALLPWAFILLFALVFLGWEKGWALPDWTWVRVLRSRLPAPSSSPLPAAMLGLGTPLLPCGPLYLVFGLALLTGSWVNGALMMVFFALGTVPLLLILQVGMIRWQGLVSPLTLRRAQRGLALVALAMMIWRVVAGDPLAVGEDSCPMCH